MKSLGLFSLSILLTVTSSFAMAEDFPSDILRAMDLVDGAHLEVGFQSESPDCAIVIDEKYNNRQHFAAGTSGIAFFQQLDSDNQVISSAPVVGYMSFRDVQMVVSSLNGVIVFKVKDLSGALVSSDIVAKGPTFEKRIGLLADDGLVDLDKAPALQSAVGNATISVTCK